MESPTAIGVDLSLVRTGVGVVGPEGFECYSFGRTGKRDEDLWIRQARIEDLVNGVQSIIAAGMEWPKIAVVEYPSTAAAGGSTLDRDHLWWSTIKMLRREKIPVVIPITQQMKIYATGHGTKHDKEEVLIAMMRRHPTAPITNNDEADAFTLAMMGARLVGEPLDGKMPQTHTRALDKLVVIEP